MERPPGQCDVAVIGGGSAGFGAALTAARRGAHVILVEREAILGGTSTAGGVSNWEPGCGAEGLPEELYNRLCRTPGVAGVYEFVRHCLWNASGGGPVFPGALLRTNSALPYSATLCGHGPEMTDEAWWRANSHGVIFEPDAMARVMREMLLETGRCEVRTGVSATAVEMDDNAIKAVRLSNGASVSAPHFIDTCGAVAALAGCRMESSPRANGATLIYRVAPARETWDGAPTPCDWAPRYPVAFCFTFPNGDVGINMLPTMDGTEALRLGEAAAYAECVRRVRAHWRWMQGEWPPFRHFEIKWIASRVAYRDTWRVSCEYRLTEDDLRRGARFDDEVATADHAFDTHGTDAPTGQLTRPYGIPFRCLRPVGVCNMLVAGRIAGFDPVAASSCRLSRTMIQLGVAAGSHYALYHAGSGIPAHPTSRRNT